MRCWWPDYCKCVSQYWESWRLLCCWDDSVSVMLLYGSMSTPFWVWNSTKVTRKLAYNHFFRARLQCLVSSGFSTCFISVLRWVASRSPFIQQELGLHVLKTLLNQALTVLKVKGALSEVQLNSAQHLCYHYKTCTLHQIGCNCVYWLGLTLVKCFSNFA